MIKVVTIAVLALCICATLAAPSRKKLTNRNTTINCDDSDILDEGGLQLFTYGDRKSWFALSKDEADNNFCPRTRQAGQRIKAYAKQCSTAFASQVIGLIVHGVSNRLKITCDSDEGSANNVRLQQCTRGKNRESLHKCSDQYVRDLEAIRDRMHNDDLKLGYSCCHFYKFKDCIVRETAKLGCDAESVQHAEAVVASSAADTLSLTCTNYEEESPNCDKLEPLILGPNKIAKYIDPSTLNSSKCPKTLLVATGTAVTRNVTVDCDNYDGFEEAGLKLLTYGDRDKWFAMSKEDAVENVCPRTRLAVQRVRTFAKQCLRPFAGQVVGLIVDGVTNQLNATCDSVESLANHVRLQQCTLDKDREDVHKCSDQYIRELEAIREDINNSNKDLKLGYVCCHFHKFKNCIVRETARLGCDAEAVQHAEDMVVGTAMAANSLTCNRYGEGSASCGQLEPLRLGSVPGSRSIISALADIYAAF
ncbi:hypothetical protein HDE_10467 [Halotydeus destructor]|nr:hypothetical protein HDE_10467 [Halotydeus destructor]